MQGGCKASPGHPWHPAPGSTAPTPAQKQALMKGHGQAHLLPAGPMAGGPLPSHPLFPGPIPGEMENRISLKAAHVNHEKKTRAESPRSLTCHQPLCRSQQRLFRQCFIPDLVPGQEKATWAGRKKENPKRRVCTECQKTCSIVRCGIRTKPTFRFKTNTHPPKSASFHVTPRPGSPRACVQLSGGRPQSRSACTLGEAGRVCILRASPQSPRRPQSSVPSGRTPASSNGAARRPLESPGSGADLQLLHKAFIRRFRWNSI